jgi:hypothetical protein
MGKPLLTLETFAPDHPTIVIDKVEYELALPGDFSIRDEAENARLLRKGTAMLERAQAGGPEDTVDEELEAELEALLGGVVDVILKAPAEVRAKLKWRQQLAIIQAFSAAVAPAAAAPRTATESRSTSAGSTPGSRRRTARPTGTASLAASSSR